MKKAAIYCALVFVGAAAFYFVVGHVIHVSDVLEPRWYALPADIPLWVAEARGDDYAWDTDAGHAVLALECLLFGLLFRAVVSWAVNSFAHVAREPIQSPQRNAGGRPSSGDSSASETPSSLGPRG